MVTRKVARKAGAIMNTDDNIDTPPSRVNEDPAHTACRKMINELVEICGEERAERYIKPYLRLSWYGMSGFIQAVLDGVKSAHRMNDEAIEASLHRPDWDSVEYQQP